MNDTLLNRFFILIFCWRTQVNITTNEKKNYSRFFIFRKHTSCLWLVHKPDNRVIEIWKKKINFNWQIQFTQIVYLFSNFHFFEKNYENKTSVRTFMSGSKYVQILKKILFF